MMSGLTEASKIKVSVIIPVYNEEKYIGRCIDSLLAQSFPLSMMEILIIDGGSNDDTKQIIESYNIDEIKTLHNPKKMVTYALNIGIDNSIGDYIIRMDAHAQYAANYIERCVFYLDNIDADNVGGVAETRGEGFIGKANAELLSSRFGVGNSQFRVNSDKDGYVDTVPFGAFRREIFQKIGKFNEEFPRSEDNDFNSRIRENGGKVFLASDIKFVYYCRDTVRGLLDQGIKNGNALFLTLRKNPKAMSLRHFIPFFFVSSLIILPLLGSISTVFKYILFMEMAAYGILDLYFSIFKGSIKFVFYKFIMYPCFHISYGVGSLIGLFGKKLY